jgi:hypothetical protein
MSPGPSFHRTRRPQGVANNDTQNAPLTYTLPSAWKENRQAEGILLTRPPRETGDDTAFALVILPKIRKRERDDRNPVRD